MNSIVSFLIPAHNAQDTIKRAIESILQVCENIEIIVAENGSTDNTTTIVERIKREHNNVTLIHTETGISKARNAAIKIATGSWICFVDADDYINAHAVEQILKNIDCLTADFCICGYTVGSAIHRVTKYNRIEQYLDVQTCRIKMLENPTFYMQVWGKLFKTSIIKENNLFFNENLIFAEDSDFTLRYTKYCESIVFLPELLYHYILSKNSVMRTFSADKVYQYTHSMVETKKAIENEQDDIKSAYNKYVLIHMNIANVREIFSIKNKMPFHSKIKTMRQLKKDPIFLEALYNTKINECLVLKLLPELLFKLKLDYVAAILFLARSLRNAWVENREQQKQVLI